MRSYLALAQAALLFQTTTAMPGPWSVPQEHFEVLALRHATPFKPEAVTDVHCWDSQAHIVYHDQNAAQLAICNGLGDRCRRDIGATTEGERGSAVFTLKAVHGGSKITLTRVKWEQCVRAARDKCPTGSLSGVCLGGANGGGDVEFVLDSTMHAVG